MKTFSEELQEIIHRSYTMQQGFVHNSHNYELHISVKCAVWNFEVLSTLDPSLVTLSTQMCPYTSKEAIILVKRSEGFKKHALQPSMSLLGPPLSKRVTEELKFCKWSKGSKTETLTSICDKARFLRLDIIFMYIALETDNIWKEGRAETGQIYP